MWDNVKIVQSKCIHSQLFLTKIYKCFRLPKRWFYHTLFWPKMLILIPVGNNFWINLTGSTRNCTEWKAFRWAKIPASFIWQHSHWCQVSPTGIQSWQNKTESWTKSTCIVWLPWLQQWEHITDNKACMFSHLSSCLPGKKWKLVSYLQRSLSEKNHWFKYLLQ